MKRAIGISFCIGNKGVYFGKLLSTTIRPRLAPTGQPHSVMHTGLRIDVVLGNIVRPIPKFWKKEFWSRDKSIKNPATNPWNSGNHWFVLRLPPIPMLFLCITIGNGKYNPGGYVGCRTARVDDWTNGKAIWDQNGEVSSFDGLAWGSWEERGNIYVEPTAALRLDMRH